MFLAPHRPNTMVCTMFSVLGTKSRLVQPWRCSAQNRGRVAIFWSSPKVACRNAHHSSSSSTTNIITIIIKCMYIHHHHHHHHHQHLHHRHHHDIRLILGVAHLDPSWNILIRGVANFDPSWRSGRCSFPVKHIVQRGWRILIPHEDKVDVVTPANIFFRASGEF